MIKVETLSESGRFGILISLCSPRTILVVYTTVLM